MKSPWTTASRRVSRALALAGIAGCAIALHAPHAAADTVCVSTNADLRDALATAQHRAMRIQIVQGTYDLHGTVWSDFSRVVYTRGGSEILGGYTAACAGRNIEVDNTVLTDSSGSDSINGFYITGDVTLEGLTFKTGLPFEVISDQRESEVASGAKILIRRDAFIDSEGGSLGLFWYQDDDVNATIRIVDTLVAGNSGLSECAIHIDNDGSTRVELVNDTVVDNGGGDEHGGGFCLYHEIDDEEASLLVYNSIFYGNTGFDLWTDTIVTSLVDDTFAEHHAPGAIELGTLTSNPRLDGDYRPIESPPSPVINSGSTSAPGGLPSTDLPGRARIVGTAPDRGAFESSVDDAFLQTVTNTNDSGAGSLRSALAGAIQHGSGIISFDIGSGCGPHVITLASELPLITVPLIINGYTQTGASANDLDVGSDAVFCVVLEAGNSTVTHGLHVPEAASASTQVTINGLAFSGFSDSAVTLNGGAQHIVVGDRFGGIASGHALQPNGIDVRIGSEASGVEVGGDDVAQRNVIGSATNSGVAMFGDSSGSPAVPSGTHDNQIINNMIGVGWSVSDGVFTNLGNGARGVYVSGYDNTISGNWIGDNTQAGVLLDGGGAQGNSIRANYIGFPWGSHLYGNGDAGIHLQGNGADSPASNSMLDNVIAENGAQGVHVGVGLFNRIRRNGIYANGALGIDLADVGVLPNDDDGVFVSVDFANFGINYPVLSAAGGNSALGTFSGTLTTLPGNYRIDFYQTPSGCDAGDNRQGLGWIASVVVVVPSASSGDQGTVSFSALRSAGDLGTLFPNAGITSTTTDDEGDTSEFSACIPYTIADRIFADGFEGH